MKLFTPQQYEELLYQGANPDDDEKPVVNLIAPNQDFAWLLSEIYPHNPEVAFGISDLGSGHLEIGEVFLPEIKLYSGKLKMAIEQDGAFRAIQSLREYYRDAVEHGYLVT